MRIAIVTNIPTPYRTPVFNLFADTKGVDLHVLYCSETEPNRNWVIDDLRHEHSFLKARVFGYGDHFFSFPLGIRKEIDRLRPDVIVCGSLGALAIHLAVLANKRGIAFIPFSDGTPDSDRNISSTRRLLRRYLVRYGSAFIGGSQKALELFRSYGAPGDALFCAPLCANNDEFSSQQKSKRRDDDLLFCGQLITRKMPHFFLDVVQELERKRPHIRSSMVGSGPLYDELNQRISKSAIPCRLAGFCPPDTLPSIYQSSRLFLFPTRMDPWGVVANEACAAGLPVITTEAAGAANELIKHDMNGYVLPPEVTIWVEKISQLLDDPSLYARLSSGARASVENYTFQTAANGMLNASLYAMNRSIVGTSS